MMLTLPFCYTIIYLTNVLCLAIQVISNFLLLQLETWIFLWGIHTEEPLWREKRWWGDESHTRTHTTAYREWRKSKVTQSCLTLCYPMDCSPPGSSVHGILLARILEWVAISFSRGSSRARDHTWVFRIAGRLFTTWATRESENERGGTISEVIKSQHPWHSSSANRESSLWARNAFLLEERNHPRLGWESLQLLICERLTPWWFTERKM